MERFDRAHHRARGLHAQSPHFLSSECTKWPSVSRLIAPFIYRCRKNRRLGWKYKLRTVHYLRIYREALDLSVALTKLTNANVEFCTLNFPISSRKLCCIANCWMGRLLMSEPVSARNIASSSAVDGQTWLLGCPTRLLSVFASPCLSSRLYFAIAA